MKKEFEKILSISVAMYNLEKLIVQNIESFTDSKARELLEVIVTDDESSDSSVKIVEEYVNKYPNTIKLIKQHNQGPGSTINSGIKNATGKYFMLVDGDDWVNTDNLNTLVDNLKKVDVDMVITDYDIYDDVQKIIYKTSKSNLPTNKIMNFEDVCRNLSLSMHATIYKTEIFQKNKIVIDNCFYTDVEYVLFPIPYVNSVIYYPFSVYVYRTGREGQSVNIKSMQKNIKMHEFILNNILNYYECNKSDMKYNTRYFMANRIAEMALSHMTILLSFEDDSNRRKKIKTFVNELKKNNSDVYSIMKKSLKIKILIYSDYHLINILYKVIKKRFS